MKIALVSNTSWYLYNFRSGIIRSLIASGHDVYTVSPQDEYAEKLVTLGASYIPIRIDNKGLNPFLDLLTLIDFYKIYKSNKIDIIFHFTIKPSIYGGLSARALGIPYVNTITGLGTAFIRKTLTTRIVKWLYMLTLDGARKVVFQNYEDRAIFLNDNLVSRENTSVIASGSGVNIDYYYYSELPLSKYDNNYSYTFLLFSRLLWDKGIGEYIEAARIVKIKYPCSRFQLLGFLEVENRSAITRETVSSWVDEGVIEYLGDTSDIRPYVAGCDCVVLPSYREGMPRSLLEAASMGRPLIATDVSGCRDVIDHGVNGFLCHIKDAHDLAMKMIDYIQLSIPEKKAMSNASRLKAERCFDETLVISNYLKFIE